MKQDKKYQEALATAELIPSTKEKVLAFADIAEATSDNTLFQRALELARTMEQSHQRASSISTIARHKKDNTLLDEAIISANSAPKVSDRDFALRHISQSFAQNGQFQKALEVIKNIQSPRQKIEALTTIAEHVCV